MGPLPTLSKSPSVPTCPLFRIEKTQTSRIKTSSRYFSLKIYEIDMKKKEDILYKNI